MMIVRCAKEAFQATPAKVIRRREVLAYGSALAAAKILLTANGANAMIGRINVTAEPFGANPNSSDNTAAFQAALNFIGKANGGTIYVPGGFYNISGPLTYTGGSLTIEGDGQHNSVLVQQHKGVCLSVNLAEDTNCFTMLNCGVSPCPGAAGWAAGCLAVSVPQPNSGFTNFSLENVDLGVPFATSAGQYTSYFTAIALTNVSQGVMRNCNAHANLTNGGIVVKLSGLCVGMKIISSNFDYYAFGVVSSNFSEGLHFIDCVFIGGTAIQTGAGDEGNNGLNFRDLFVDNCELNCQNTALALYEVAGARIVNSNIAGPTNVAASNIGILMQGCSSSIIEGCTFGGSWTPSMSTPIIGVVLNASSKLPTVSCSVNECSFENTSIAVVFGVGAMSNTASNISLFQYGLGALVNGSYSYGSTIQQVYVDNSGNTSNNASWNTSSNTASVTYTKRVGSQH